MFKFVVFAEEDAKQYGIAGDLHDHVHFIVLIAVASKTPAHTRDQAQHQRQADIGARSEPLSVADEVKCLQAE